MARVGTTGYLFHRQSPTEASIEFLESLQTERFYKRFVALFLEPRETSLGGCPWMGNGTLTGIEDSTSAESVQSPSYSHAVLSCRQRLHLPRDHQLGVSGHFRLAQDGQMGSGKLGQLFDNRTQLRSADNHSWQTAIA